MNKKKMGIALFLVPASIVFIIVFATSLVTLFATSFTDWYIGGSPVFNWGANYIEIFKDEAFTSALFNTFIWIFLQSTIHLALGVTVAIILSRKKWYWKFVRTVYMIPNIISAAAVGMMFVFILNPNFGLVNVFIRTLGFENFAVNWFGDSKYAFFSVTLTWLPYAATVTILTLAEMSAIDKSLFEAASVDGATEMQTIRFVTLPMLRNIIGTCAILSATSMLQKLDILMMTTKGGPLNYTLNLPLYIYDTTLMNNNFGMANTAGVYLILVGLAAVLMITKLFKLNKQDV